MKTTLSLALALAIAVSAPVDAAAFQEEGAMNQGTDRKTQKTTGPEATVRTFLASHDREAMEALLAPDFRLWFGKKEGDGIARDAYLTMLEWDFALDPAYRIEDLRVDGREVVARLHEENDFSRLIGYPGWSSTAIFTVAEDGRIASFVYVPKEGQPGWEPYLEKALPWLREHHADVLARIYPDGKLQMTGTAAREWVTILRAWRAATE